ncbi:GOLGA8H isoform 1, partial [Pongo abelii]
LKEYWQKNSPRVPAGVNRNRKTNGSIPETATSGGCQSPGDSARDFHREGPTSSATLKDLESPCQELAVVLDSRSVKISQLKNTIKALKQQKKQVEHQLEEEKKANNKKQKAERELEVQIQTLNIQKGKLNTDLYHMKRSLRYFEEESKDLAIHLQHSLQRKRELERALSAVTTTQEKEISFSSHSKARMEWKLEHSIQEQALLKAQVTQLKESFKQAQLERDECVQHLKGERARWQQRMRKMSQEVCTLKNEKKDDMRRIEKLERSLSKLKNQMAEPLPPEPPEPPAMSSKVELQHLRKELERVAGELQAQVKNNQRISLLNRGQEERIQVQEERLRKQEERLEEQQERLQQLAKPQSIFEELNNEHKSALQLKQQVKELQEKLGEEHLEATSQQNQQLTTQLSLMALPGEEFLAAAQNPADEPGPGAPAPQELGAADKHGDLCEVSLTSSAQGEAREGPLYDNPTTQPIVQDHQEHPGLGSNCCVPFFCWAWLLRRRR